MNLQFIYKWMNSGITEELDRQLIKPVRIINLFGTTLGIFILPYIYIFRHIGAPGLSYLCVPIVIYYLLVPVYNRRGWYAFSRVSFILIGGGVIFLYAISLGKSTGIQYMFFLTMFAPFLVYLSHEKWKRLFGFVYIPALFALLEVYYALNGAAFVQIDESMKNILYYFIVPTILALEVLLIYYMYYNNQQAESQLEDANKSLEKAMSMLWGEMELARKIQTVLIPEKPVLRGFDIVGFMMPAKDIGGDYFDIINVNGRDWLAIGDVSGHGVSAGLIMMMAQTAIQTAVRQSPDISPSRMLEIINEVLRNNVNRLGEDKYMTLNIFSADKNGDFTFSGLHQDILLYRSKTGDVEVIETTGMWVGMVDDLGEMNSDGAFSMDHGDILLLYTDGLTEARDSKNNMYTLRRLKEIFKDNAGTAIEHIKDEILEELKPFRIDDDVTIIIAKRL